MSFNLCVLVFGPPGAGKTSFSDGLIEQHLDSGDNCYAFVHDPNQQYREVFGCWYPDAAAAAAALAAAGKSGKPISRGVAVGGSSSKLVELCLALGEKWNRVDSVRMRILLVIDESSLADSSSAHHMDAQDNALLANRRHRGIGVVYLMQRTKMLPTQFVQMSTHVVLFRQSHPKRLRDLEEDLCVPPMTLEPATQLDDFECIVCKNGKGLLRPGEPIL